MTGVQTCALPISGGGSITGTMNVTDGKWHHVVCVRGAIAPENRLYVDGQLEGSFTDNNVYTSGFDSEVALNIGWLNLSPFYHFSGELDEIALYDRSLTTDEIQQHFRAGRFGDLTGDNAVSTSDAIVGLKVLSGLDPVELGEEWENDGYTQIGLDQVLYIMQKTAGIKMLKYQESEVVQ